MHIAGIFLYNQRLSPPEPNDVQQLPANREVYRRGVREQVWEANQMNERDCVKAMRMRQNEQSEYLHKEMGI